MKKETTVLKPKQRGTAIFFRIEDSLKDKLQSLADKDNRKLADYIRLQLSKLIKS